MYDFTQLENVFAGNTGRGADSNWCCLNHPCGSVAGTVTGKVKLSWPVGVIDAGLFTLRKGILTFKDPNWYGNQAHTSPGQVGMDIGHVGKGEHPTVAHGRAGEKWLPDIKVLAAADGEIISIVTDEDDECLGDGIPKSHCGDGCPDSCEGNYITIDHDPDGSLDLFKVLGYRYTHYAHMEKSTKEGVSLDINVGTLYKGYKVTRGQQIGNIGSSGNSKTPHLRFSVHATVDADGKPNDAGVDPFYSARGFGSNVTESLWEDQCDLPIYNICNGYTVPPPKPEPEPKAYEVWLCEQQPPQCCGNKVGVGAMGRSGLGWVSGGRYEYNKAATGQQSPYGKFLGVEDLQIGDVVKIGLPAQAGLPCSECCWKVHKEIPYAGQGGFLARYSSCDGCLIDENQI